MMCIVTCRWYVSKCHGVTLAAFNFTVTPLWEKFGGEIEEEGDSKIHQTVRK